MSTTHTILTSKMCYTTRIKIFRDAKNVDKNTFCVGEGIFDVRRDVDIDVGDTFPDA